MKAITIIKRSLLSLVVIPALLFAGGGKALAAQIPYDQIDTLAPTTPAFNIYTGVPFGVGDESDFVKIRPSNGNPIDNGPNNTLNLLYANTLNEACNAGDMYDVSTYIHNGADDDFNDDGNGTAVAHNAQLTMTAKIGEDSKTFPFASTITADNAATVTDGATLNCNKNVRLEVVVGSIKAYNKTSGWLDWMGTDTTPVNSTVSIGSKDMNSGEFWGCFGERVRVVYTVKVVEVTPPTPIYSCDLLTNTGKISDNKYGFKVDYTAKNGATFKNVTYVYSDGSTSTDGATTTHLFTNNDATKKVTATVHFDVNGEDKTGEVNPKCATEFTKTTVVTPPKVLPSTGAGSTIAIFSATSVLGAFLYRLRVLRSLR